VCTFATSAEVARLTWFVVLTENEKLEPTAVNGRVVDGV
jgi:hypothetical protein